MRVLCVHPGPLMYTKIFLRLEPLGLELVAAAIRKQGHEVYLIDLQTEDHAAYHRVVADWQPDVITFSCNYLANVPEIIDLAKDTKAKQPGIFILVGGHSASFVAHEMLEHAEGAIDCMLRGEGEAGIGPVLDIVEAGGQGLAEAAGTVSTEGEGPKPGFIESLDDLMPARDLLRHRNRYFLGMLDPCASIEFSRGCPWDCAFCSAWTFYGRSYRLVSPERAVEDMASIGEPGVFIVDDVAFIQEKHGLAIGEAIARRGIKKEYYLETRGDVLIRNKDVFRFWRDLGMKYMFLGLEAIDEEGLKKYRKRASLGTNFEALEFARSLGIQVAVNIIADPDWDEERFRVIREWCLEVPEIVNISVNTPYPGTESWVTDGRRLTTRDYLLFDIQHAVLPTKLPLEKFYKELVDTQRVLNHKHLGFNTMVRMGGIVSKLALRGQTNFLKMLWKFNSVYNHELLLADHQRDVKYQIPLPPERPVQPQAGNGRINAKDLYIHEPKLRKHRQTDKETEKFVEATRL